MTHPAAPNDIVIEYVVLRCADIERSRAFFEAIGLAFVHERHGNGPEHYACTLGPCVLELYPAPREPSRAMRIGLGVRDLALAIARVTHVGGEVVRFDGGTALVRDPDGNDIALIASRK